MTIGLFTYGSRGDVQPFVALANGLIQQEVQVILYAPENFRDFVENYNIPYKALSGNADEILNSAEGRRVLKTGNAISLVRLMQREGKKIQEQLNKDLLKGCSEVDFIISSALCHIWISCIAEKLHKKWGLIGLNPPTTPTKEFPFAGLSMMNNGWYNPVSHQFFQYLYWKVYKKDINIFRKSLGLSGLNSNIMNRITKNNILNLYATSPSLIKRPSDWPANSDISGYLFVAAINNEFNTELNDWLLAGDKPIYFSFGRMPVPDPELLVIVLKELLQTSNLRFVFCKGWSRLPNLPVHKNLFVMDTADHQWLLPRCQMAIIHGGAGSIGASLRAGIPVIIVSVFRDQPWWGKIIRDKNLGLHLPFKKLNSSSLLSAIKAIHSSEIPKNVQDIGSKIRNEDGVRTASMAIKTYFRIEARS